MNKLNYIKPNTEIIELEPAHKVATKWQWTSNSNHGYRPDHNRHDDWPREQDKNFPR